MNTYINKVLIIIPARGGSKGIPKKNIRLLDGKPLIEYGITIAKHIQFDRDIVVSTDDIEIKRIAEMSSIHVIDRPSKLADDKTPLDPVIFHALIEAENYFNRKYDIVVTLQPTSPLLKTDTLERAFTYFIDNQVDTLISGINKPHLSWTEKDCMFIPLYKERVNRQYLPKNIIETGSFLISKRCFICTDSRIGKKISMFEVPEDEAIDIDSPKDWWIAEKILNKKKVIFRVDGYSEIGLGHIYRCLHLAYNMIDHDVLFVLSSKSDIGIKKTRESSFPYKIIETDNDIINIIHENSCDILINDILNTSKDYVQVCKKNVKKVVNFEDRGEGALLADVTINDLYEKDNDSMNHYWGSRYYCLRDEFLLSKSSNFNEKAKKVLILFGGTDPNNLTLKSIEALKMLPKELNLSYTIVLGLGYKCKDEILGLLKDTNLEIDIYSNVRFISDIMRKADIAISSQGRTMYELSSLLVPTILLAQNKRELLHEYGCITNGFLNLGLGSDVPIQAISETLLWLIKSPNIRKQMRNQMMKNDLTNGTQRVLKLILS